MQILFYHAFNIDYNCCSQLKFADDLVISKTLGRFSTYYDLSSFGCIVKLRVKMNIARTKVMLNHSGISDPMMIGNENLETVDRYVYSNRTLSFGVEINIRRILPDVYVDLAWVGFVQKTKMTFLCPGRGKSFISTVVVSVSLCRT